MAQVYGDFDIEILVLDAESQPPATPATPATQHESSRQNNNVETDSSRNVIATQLRHNPSESQPSRKIATLIK